MRGDLTEVYLVGFILCKLSRSGKHGLNSTTGQSMVSLHNELVPITEDQLNIHGIRTLASSINSLSCVHGSISCSHHWFKKISCRSESSKC